MATALPARRIRPSPLRLLCRLSHQNPPPPLGRWTLARRDTMLPCSYPALIPSSCPLSRASAHPPLCSKLYNQGPNETTVFLGPWEVVNTEPRRVVWQCSYAGEVLEHFCKFPFPVPRWWDWRGSATVPPHRPCRFCPTSLARFLNQRS